MTKPIDESLRQFSGYNIKRAFTVIQSDVNASLKPFGLRMLSFSVLSVITANTGLRQSQLADALAMERPNIVQLIDELEVAGWIIRNRDPNDRRAWVLTSTLKGREMCAKATAAVQAHDTRMIDGLSDDDRKGLITILRRIEANGHKGKEDGHAAVSTA
ncbi:MAG: MarR family transcriptional regulator [Hyphomicrobiales bacterium]|nr:MAG: MarR family transcriptional regulator [Hyphomicrobiales bacterium]